MNDLSKIEKNLRTIAKRYKSINIIDKISYYSYNLLIL